jgi:hypothetical protein
MYDKYNEYNDPESWLDDEPAIDLNKLEKSLYQGLAKSIENTINSGLNEMVSELNAVVGKELSEIPDSIMNALNKNK